jgi:hypothetical protein
MGDNLSTKTGLSKRPILKHQDYVRRVLAVIKGTGKQDVEAPICGMNSHGIITEGLAVELQGLPAASYKQKEFGTREPVGGEGGQDAARVRIEKALRSKTSYQVVDDAETEAKEDRESGYVLSELAVRQGKGHGGVATKRLDGGERHYEQMRRRYNRQRVAGDATKHWIEPFVDKLRNKSGTISDRFVHKCTVCKNTWRGAGFNYWGFDTSHEPEVQDRMWKQTICRPHLEDPLYDYVSHVELKAKDKVTGQGKLSTWLRSMTHANSTTKAPPLNVQIARHNAKANKEKTHTIKISPEHIGFECTRCPYRHRKGPEQKVFWTEQCGFYDDPAMLEIANAGL